MKYCKHCGAQVRDEAIFCPACGCSTEDQTSFTNKNKESGLQIAAKIFMILSCALTAPTFLYTLLLGGWLAVIFLLPLSWRIPMTVEYIKSLKGARPRVGIGFKICTLLFVSLVAGILMLCDSQD